MELYTRNVIRDCDGCVPGIVVARPFILTRYIGCFSFVVEVIINTINLDIISKCDCCDDEGNEEE